MRCAENLKYQMFRYYGMISVQGVYSTGYGRSTSTLSGFPGVEGLDLRALPTTEYGLWPRTLNPPIQKPKSET